MEATHYTDWRPFPHYSFEAVRVGFAETPHGLMQRHEWKRQDGIIDIEDWIPSPCPMPQNARPNEGAP